MNRVKSSCRMVAKIRKLTSFVLVLCLLIFIPASITSAAGSGSSGGSGGLVTLTATVNGLLTNEGINVYAEKEIDGVLTTYQEVTDSSGNAIFKIPFGGTARVYGEDKPGYITPSETVALTQLRGNLSASCTLSYVVSQVTIPVTGIIISLTEHSLLVGETIQLSASVTPSNASNQEVIWSSNNEAAASVSSTGLVTSISMGNAVITASSVDGAYTAVCNVTIEAITSVSNPDPEIIEANPGITMALPNSVSAVLSSGNPIDLPVSWRFDTETGDATILTEGDIQYISFLTTAELIDYPLTGTVAFTDYEAHVTISLLGEAVIPVESAVLMPAALSLYLGLDRNRATLTLSVWPEGADAGNLLWESSNEAVLQIESISADNKSAVIIGLTAGTAIIRVRVPGAETALAFSTVNVAIDPLLTDPAYISATLENDPAPVDQFATREAVWIRCYDLPDGKYYIEVADKGSGLPLGTGSVDVICVDPDGEGPARKEFKYQLSAEAYFSLTNSYSNSYFVSMSMDPSFPSGDDEVSGLPKTFADNFKITSPVPTGQIVVNVEELIGGNPSYPSQSMVGRHVILCREIDEAILDIQYEDYLLSPAQPGSDPVFSDEVKLIGHIQADGSVLWENPKEVLKIGGYILLVELPQGYESNLDEVNPEGDAGELLKEVHILRRTTVYRSIQVWNT